MKRRPRIYYSESHKTLMWERWRKGDSLQQIAQFFDQITRPLNEALAHLVAAKLQSLWSPEQIAGRFMVPVQYQA